MASGRKIQLTSPNLRTRTIALVGKRIVYKSGLRDVESNAGLEESEGCEKQ